MTVILGLLAALGWGITDLLARFSGRAIGTYRAMFFVQCPGLAAMSVWLALDHADLARAIDDAPWQAWAAGLVAAPLVLIASTALFRALAIGRLGVVSPVTASYGAVTAALAALSGEALSSITIGGIATTVAGVALASTPAPRGGGAAPARQRSLRGVGWALLASAGYGLGSWVQGRFAVPALGYIVPMWLYYAMGVVIMAALAVPARQSLLPPPLRAWPVVFGTGGFSVGAYTAFAAGLATGRIAEVTVLSTLSSGVAALLGRIVLHEQLARHQWAGVLAILAGIALINSGR
jgi:drug/metabolite transporter (DMT)-like permease